MINVALVSHSRNLFGAERSLMSLAGLFSNKSAYDCRKSNQIHPILMIPTPENGEMSEVAQSCGFDMVYTPPNPWYIYKSPKEQQNFDIFCKNIKEYTKTFIELFEENKVDVVLVNTLTNFIPNIAAFISGLPTITWIHGVLDASSLPGIDTLYQTSMDRGMLILSNKLIYCSRWTEKHFESFTNKKHSVTIPNWTLEPAEFTSYNKVGNKFICLNSMQPKKGIDVLVDACRILKDEGYNFHVALYGIGPELQNVIDQVKSMDLNCYISINPRTTDVAKLYNGCNALIQPSYYESFGRTIIEAMSHKRAVIAAVTADPEKNITDGKSGFHVESGNSRQLADKMIYIINNPQEAEAMGKNGYKIFKSRLDGKKAKKKLTKLIYKLYKTQPKPTQTQYLDFDVMNLIHKESFNLK